MTTHLWFLDNSARVLLDASAAGGACDVVELVAPAGHQPPPHVHDSHGESWTVLEGETAFSPAGEAHALEVTSDIPCRMMVSSVPAGFAAFVADLAVPAEDDGLPPAAAPDLERLAEVCRRHGIAVLPALPQLV